MSNIDVEELKRVGALLREQAGLSLFAYALEDGTVYQVDIVERDKASVTPAYKVKESSLERVEGETHEAEFFNDGSKFGSLVDTVDGKMLCLINVP